MADGRHLEKNEKSLYPRNHLIDFDYLYKDVPFGGCIYTAPHFGSQLPKKPTFWSV